MTTRKIALLLICVLFVFGGCISENDIKVLDYKGIQIKRLTNTELLLDVVVSVQNDGGKITLKEFDFDLLTRDGYTLANIHSENEIEVVKGVTTDLTLPIAGSLPGGFLSAISLTSALSSGSENIMIVGHITARSGMISKNIKVECSLKELADNLGLKNLNFKNGLNL